jgi:hypothetical protein
MAKKIKWVPTAHPINAPHTGGNIEANFLEDAINEIENIYTDVYGEEWGGL